MPEDVVFPDEFTTYVKELLEFFTTIVGAQEYHCTVRFADHPGDEDEDIQAEITIDSVYLNLDCRITRRVLKFWETQDYNDIARTVCHELCHVLLDPLARMTLGSLSKQEEAHWREALERQTCRLTNTVMSLLDNHQEIPKPPNAT